MFDRKSSIKPDRLNVVLLARQISRKSGAAFEDEGLIMTIVRKIALPIIGAAGLLCFAAPAFAQQEAIVVTSKMKIPKGFEPVKKVVKIKDLNLVTPADERRMERRVRAAVTEICPVPARPARWQLRDAKTCSDFAWAGARPQMAEAIRKARGL